MPQRPTCFITYFGVDGAAAAAAALRAEPAGQLVTASAASIGRVLAELPQCGDVHVLGVGVHCPWGTVTEALAALRENGATVVWHCGRGYLDAGQFAPHCMTAFVDTGTNTAAVARYFGLDDAALPEAIAWYDRNVAGAKEPETAVPEEQEWLDLTEAAIAQYLKFRDEEPYLKVIRCLAAGAFGLDEQRLLDAFLRIGWAHMLHGRAQSIKDLKQRIQRCADADRHVLITGESGVGKENVAHLIWERSSRSLGPFIPVNCAMYAGSANLANSDLFGHKKGAFTGATRDRRGRFVEADGGIIFLDELGELPLEVQAKLLRVLEDGRVTPEGADMPERQVNVRIVAATNRNLPAMIRDGSFRADLYHRLATLRVHVPPLRDRAEDIAEIVEERLAVLEREGYSGRFTKKDGEALEKYAWPGNVRQLIKIVERAVMLDMPVKDVLDEERELGEMVESNREDGLWPSATTNIMPMTDVQRRYARRAWELHGNNYAATARALGVTTNTLRYTYLAPEKDD